MPKLGNFYGDGVAVGDDLVLKAHLRVRLQDSGDLASREAADVLRLMHEGAFAAVEKAAVDAAADGPFGRGRVYVSDGRRVGSNFLSKAAGGVAPIGPPKKVSAPGSRGGKWYRTKSGEIRYGTKPMGEDAGVDLTQEEVREHLKHFRPTPFTGDREFVQHLIANAVDYQLPVNGLLFLNWWFGEGMQKFMGAYGLSREDMMGDLSRLRLQDAEMGDTSYEEAVHHFVRSQEWGASDKEVDAELRALFDRYQNVVAHPKVVDSWDNAGSRAADRLRMWFADAHAREDDFHPLAEAVVGGADQPAAAARAVAALASLGLLIVPARGKASTGGMKGIIAPNSGMLAEHDRKGLLLQPDETSKLLSLSTGQLAVVYMAAALHAMFDPERDTYVAGAVPSNKLGQDAIHALRRRAGIDKASGAAVARNLDEVVGLVAERLNAANSGDDVAARALFDAGHRGKLSDESIAEAQKSAVDLARFREKSVRAQDDDSFVLPSSMAKGRWGVGGDKPFEHQRQAMNWMEVAKRGVLSLDTSLGKTASVIGLVERLREGTLKPDEKAILLLPTSLMLQWPAEIAKYAPDSAGVGEILSLHDMTREEMSAVLQDDAIRGRAKYIVAPASILAAPPPHEGSAGVDVLDVLRDIPGPLFVDEVHQSFRNPDALRVRALKHVIGDRDYAFGLTGTPDPNEPRDAHALASLFVGDKVGPRELWDGRFGGTQWDDVEQQWAPTNREDLRGANRLLKPFVFVRSALDSRVRADMGMRVQAPIHQNFDLIVPPEVAPYLERGGVADVMADAKVTALEEAGRARLPNRDMLRAGLALGYRRLAAFSPVLIDSEYVGPAPKLDRLVKDLIAHFTDGSGARGAPAVVFSSFPGKVFPLLKDRLVAAGVHPSQIGMISGASSALERRFQQEQLNDGRVKVLLAGIKAGGAGLELQHKANAAFFPDEPYDPGAKQQAVRRLVRLGQKDVVTVNNYRLASPDAPDWAVEDRIAGKQVKAAWLLGARDPELDARKQVGLVVGRQGSPLQTDRALRLVDAARKAPLGPDTLGEDVGEHVRDGDPAAFDLDVNFKVHPLPAEVPEALRASQDVRDQFRKFVERYQEEQFETRLAAAKVVAAAHKKSGNHEAAAKYEARAAGLKRRAAEKLKTDKPKKRGSK